ncbi:hypothetical protein AX16_001509 [Volvariella volvacea WC 439]|nr:hypothetical protein AX16_001509 [Volvariella volvacea WC 439]
MVEASDIDIPKTFGALLIGGLVASGFTGVVTSQVYAYFKLFPDDRQFIKVLVFVVWILDCGHSVFVASSLWHHFITAFGDPLDIIHIHWSLASEQMTVAFTATLTLLVHSFFIHRIHKLSLNNWFISAPLGILAFLRLGFACRKPTSLIKLQDLTVFVQKFRWSFTMGLLISSILDILLTGFLCWLLMRSQKETSSLNHILDKLMLYAFENGSLTTAATVVSLLCWLIMPTNLIFMGLHFVISKFYANSLLATLNRRKRLQEPQIYTHNNQSHAGSFSPSRRTTQGHGGAGTRGKDTFTQFNLKNRPVTKRQSRATDVTLSPSRSSFFDVSPKSTPPASPKSPYTPSAILTVPGTSMDGSHQDYNTSSNLESDAYPYQDLEKGQTELASDSPPPPNADFNEKDDMENGTCTGLRSPAGSISIRISRDSGSDYELDVEKEAVSPSTHSAPSRNSESRLNPKNSEEGAKGIEKRPSGNLRQASLSAVGRRERASDSEAV